MHTPGLARRTVAVVTALMLALSLAAPVVADDDDDDDRNDDTRTYHVTITIVGEFEDNGQPLTPPLIVATEQRHELFKVGRRASFELQQIAENGSLAPALAEFPDAYDAGTEVNTEDFADMVPPCQGLIGVSSGEPSTGTTNPALAEGGRIRHHAGIAGIADLDPDVHGWTDPVATVVVTRIA